MARKLITHQRLSRRETIRLVGAAGAAALVGRSLLGAPAAAQETAAPACILTPALTEGPYFVDEKLNRSDIRTDPADGSVRAGVPLVLRVTVQRVVNGSCSPLQGAREHVWHSGAL